MRVLIIGCGYVGTPVGTRLAREGHEVFGMRRDGDSAETLRDHGIQPLVGDITNPEIGWALPDPIDWVINTVSSSGGGPEVYREVYLGGSRHILEWLRGQNVKRYIYTGSTSVYAQSNGSWVTESSPTLPLTETGRILVETEQLAMHYAAEYHIPITLLRVAGIYGPGRGHLFLKYLEDRATLTGDGSNWINMIHLNDLVNIICNLLKLKNPSGLYNVCDDQPVRQVDFFRFLSETLNRPMPPSVNPDSMKGRKRGVTNKQVSNALMHEDLGLHLVYPTYQEGYSSEIKRMTEEETLYWQNGRAELRTA